MIRRVTIAGVVTTYAGSTAGSRMARPDGEVQLPRGIGGRGQRRCAGRRPSNNRIRRILRAGNVAGAVQTLAGADATTSRSADGIGTAA